VSSPYNISCDSDFQNEFKNYKKTFYSYFSMIHSCTLKVARLKHPKKLKFTLDGLKYYFIKFIFNDVTFKKSKKFEDELLL